MLRIVLSTLRPYLPLLLVFIAGGYVWLAQFSEEKRTPAEPALGQNLTTTPRQSAVPISQRPSPLIDIDDELFDEYENPDLAGPEEPGTSEERLDRMEAEVKQALSQIAPLPTQQLVRALQDAILSRDNTMLSVAEDDLIERGKKDVGTAAKAIQAALEGAPPHIQEYLVSLLGEIATVEALQSLLEILESPNLTPEVKLMALGGIAEIGEYREDPVSPQALSSLLEDYFDTVSKSDPQPFGAVAAGLSTVGTASGVEKLLRFIEEYKVSGTTAPNFTQQIVAALLEVRNIEAVTPLKQRLLSDVKIEREITHAVGEALAAMGKVQATEALLEWASEVSGEVQTKQALAWFSKVRDGNSLQLLLSAGDRIHFRDPQLLEEITELAEMIDEQSRPRLIYGSDDTEEYEVR